LIQAKSPPGPTYLFFLGKRQPQPAPQQFLRRMQT